MSDKSNRPQAQPRGSVSDEAIRQSLLGKAREFAGRLQENSELEQEGRAQAERGRLLREQGGSRDRSNGRDEGVGPDYADDKRAAQDAHADR